VAAVRTAPAPRPWGRGRRGRGRPAAGSGHQLVLGHRREHRRDLEHLPAHHPGLEAPAWLAPQPSHVSRTARSGPGSRPAAACVPHAPADYRAHDRTYPQRPGRRLAQPLDEGGRSELRGFGVSVVPEFRGSERLTSGPVGGGALHTGRKSALAWRLGHALAGLAAGAGEVAVAAKGVQTSMRSSAAAARTALA